MRSLSLLAIAAFSQTLGSPLQVLEPFNTENEVSKVWFEDIDGNKLSGEDLVELPDQDVTTLLDGGRRGRSLASGRISQQLLDSLKKNGSLTVDANGLSCIKKLMFVEYTDYTEAMTCVHKTKERCHDTFVTQFEPHQEQVCDEKFEKTCTISYENVAVNEEVEVCKTYLCPDCTRDGPDECQTVYDTVCETKRKVHEVEDDVVNCETIVEKKCVDVKDGLLVKQECDTWPVEKCSVEKVKVRKTTPDTSCREESRELCAPKGCAEKQCHSCENQVKAAVIAKPVEECDLEPQKVCRHVTKLVPHLVSTSECVDVPQEVCGVSKINPVKKTRPAIKNWCFKSEECSPGFELNEETGECDRKCKLGFKLNKETGKCVRLCLLGFKLNKETGKCVKQCQTGFKLNEETGECIKQCRTGFKLNEETGECVKQCQTGFKLNEETGECVKECPPGSELNEETGKCVCRSGVLNEYTNECEVISGKTLLENIVFFGFSSEPSGVVTTIKLIGRGNVDPAVECQFNRRILSPHAVIDTVNNEQRVVLEGLAGDLGSYRTDGECGKAPLDGELSGKFGSVTVTEDSQFFEEYHQDSQVDWDGVKMCLDWDDRKAHEWFCELSFFKVVPGGKEYSIDCNQDRPKCKPFL